MINTEDYQKRPMVVIADDLTGANEIGIIFAEHNKKTFIVSERSRDEDIGSFASYYDGLVINLDSRSLNGEDAYKRIKSFLSRSEKIRERLIYKKIDSTIRGNLAEETDAIIDLKFIDVIFFVPALPKIQRITVGGYHLVNGVPINKSQYVRGVKSVEASYLPTLLGEKSRYKVGKIPLEVVESGYKEIIKYAKAYYRKGIRIMVGDACMDEDLRNIKDAILNIDLRVLPMGSAGLFQQFFPPENLPNVCPCLIVCGSLNEVAHAQMRRLVEECGAKNIELNLSQIFKNKDNELKRIDELSSSILRKGYDLILSTPRDRYCPSLTIEPKEKNHIATGIDEFISLLVSRIMEKQKISGLILAGGSTSSAVISNLAITGIEIRKQLAPLIPMGILSGGPFDGLPVITKAGGFGQEDVLMKAVRYLRKGV